MTHEIHTVTTISHHPDKEHLHSSPRCWGYYPTREQAIDGLNRCVSDEAGYYTHVVIERFTPGIYAVSDQVEWFVYEANKWLPIGEPEFSRSVINYGMG